MAIHKSEEYIAAEKAAIKPVLDAKVLVGVDFGYEDLHAGIVFMSARQQRVWATANARSPWICFGSEIKIIKPIKC